MSLGKVPMKAKCEHGAGHAGIHRDPESGNHHLAPSHWDTQWRHLPTCVLTTASQEGGKGREGKGETAAQMHNLVLEMHELPEQVHVI